MESDPWQWDSSQVQRYFREHAVHDIADRPSGQLPGPHLFITALHDNEVDGASLLDSVDINMLRGEFGVTSLRHRGSIMHCIKKLQRRSNAFRSRRDSPIPQILASPHSTPVLPPIDAAAAPAAAAPITPNHEATGENTRVGEVRIEDEHGRKRRKLNLTTQVPILPVPSRHDQSSYLPDTGVPVDTLFYGNTKMGKIIGELQPEGSVIVEDDDPENNFQFTDQHKRPGEIEFVSLRLRHFLTDVETINVRRRERDAIAILPYPERLQTKAHSATVIQASQHDGGEPIAVREQALFIGTGLDYSGLEHSSTGELDYMLHKYKQTSDDGLSLGDLVSQTEQGRSDDGEGQETSDNDDDNRESDADSQAEESDDEDALNKSRAGEIVDAFIQSIRARWEQKELPKLEKSAWSVWKQMKQSKTIRDAMIAASESRANDYNRRLNKLRETLLQDEWRTEHSLQDSCRVLEPTVCDREKERWKIGVLQRKKEPEHTVHHRGKQTTIPSHGPADPQRAAPFVPIAADRMSVSPTTPNPLYSETDGNATTGAADEDGEDFHTPSGSPIAMPHDNEMDGFLASDELSPRFDEESDREQSMQERTPSPQVHFNNRSGSRTQQTPYGTPVRTQHEMPDRAVEGGDKGTNGESPVRCHVCKARLTGNEQEQTAHVDECLSKKQIMDAESDDDLVSPAALIARSQRPPSTTKRSRGVGLSTQPIELSSDTTSPAPKKPGRKPKGVKKMKEPEFTGAPDEAGYGEVDSWTWNVLHSKGDRGRFLVKMIREMDVDTRKDLHDCLLNISDHTRMIQQIGAAAKTHDTGDAENAELDPNIAETMLFCARIAMTWLTLDAKYFLSADSMGAAPWAEFYNNDKQTSSFVLQFMHFLKMKDKRTFTGPKQGPLDAPIELSDSGDEVPRRTPHKKRKRKVKESQTAKQSRNAALARHEQFTQLMESQDFNSSQAVAAVARDPSKSEIAINPMMKGDPDKDEIFIHPRIAKRIKPHQLEGVQFMWFELTTSREDDDTNTQGCLLAHTMGLGKTMQTVALLVALMEAAESDNPRVYEQLPSRLRVGGEGRQLRTMILCPPTLLQNWNKEIRQWAPKNFTNVFVVEASSKAADQLQDLEDWHRFGGILCLGYSMFRQFVVRKGDQYGNAADRLDTILLQGPDVVVADEAHNLRNLKSKLTQAAHSINTETRIALTGTPMSNDVQEIYSLVSWVAPDYLGDQTWFKANFAEPIEQGTYEESTRYERRRSMKKLAVLQHDIKPKVNRASIEALRGSLKPKVEFVITVPLTEIQDKLYKRYVQAVLGDEDNAKASQVRIFSWLAVLGLLTNHPTAFRQKLLTPALPKKGNKKKSNGREASPTPSEDGSHATVAVDVSNATELDGGMTYGDEDVFTLGFTEQMVKEIIADVDASVDPTRSAKTSLVLDILRHSEECGDKVLVFSSSIPTLNYFSDLFASTSIRYGRIDGSTKIPDRIQLIEQFHKNSFDVFLISTRAGGVGLNIQGANRVIIMDFGFNPAWEEQAIGRVYRLGQEKPVFVYRFLAGGTYETNMWNKQLFKTSLTQRVVDKKNPRRNARRNTREFLHVPETVKQEDVAQWIGKDPDVLDKILARHGPTEPGKIDTLIRNISTTETLQEEVPEELDDEEKKEVAAEIAEGAARPRGRKAIAMAQQAAMLAAGSGLPPASTQGAQPHGQSHRKAAGYGVNAAVTANGRQPPASTAPLPAHPQGGLPNLAPTYQYGGYQQGFGNHGSSHGHPR
ncbi:hypothetical protein D0864_10943 [Hortaea werneckii]|uniref:Helicase C-terminal domain-containing protein n=1 Tax=Hortaea werneckii TaxID=91943 RepID=A0A3M7FNT8_HORWE|nr:hypothetical protein D0864_10943 [Hortaea werneckii]RMY90031.1 hypothetical protein D0862_10066 [Hortaea werneckii]